MNIDENIALYSSSRPTRNKMNFRTFYLHFIGMKPIKDPFRWVFDNHSPMRNKEDSTLRRRVLRIINTSSSPTPCLYNWSTYPMFGAQTFLGISYYEKLE